MRPEYKSKSILKTLRPFMGFALLTGGLIAVSPAAEAEGVAAGTDISNTATASYEDPNDPNKPIETISNTVKVAVAKVAGIEIVSNGYTDTNGGKLVAGDEAVFNYKLVNTGNAAVQFSVPGAATVSNNADFQKVEYKKITGPGPNDFTWEPITNGSATIIPGAVPVDGFVEVRVVVNVKTGTTSGNLEVSLGKTSTINTQNVQRGAGAETDDSQDVFTVDITGNATLAPTGNAVNGVREASRQQTALINAENQAFVNINMTAGTPVAGDTTITTDDKITYDISVKVDPDAPIGSNKAPSDLAPTAIKVDTDGDPNTPPTTVDRVVISNPVPTNVDPSKVTAPTGWTPVYSLSAPNTPADQIVWIPVPPSGVLPTPDQINFVGFIKNDDTVLAKSSTPYTGFQVEVVTTGIGPTGGTVNNTATVYGSTPGDPTKLVVSDTTGTNAVNEPNSPTPVITLIAGPGSIFNGPNQKPQAVGPGVTGDINNDYTNKSVQIAATDLTGTVNPATGLPDLNRPVNASFNNTIENKGTTAADIYLLPTVPSDPASLPNGTLVKITYGNESVTYTYNNSGAGSYTQTTASTTGLPVKVPVGANGTDTYGVQVTLPVGVKQLTGYDAPITAFTGVVPAAGATTVPGGVQKNTTIDRVYTGYLKLTKETRILAEDANGVKAPVAGTDGTFSSSPKSAAPRQFIEYRVKYENVSIGGGTDNVDLKASKVKIEEDGIVAPNTWGNTTAHEKNSAINTVDGSVAGSIIFSPAGKDNTNIDVTGYRVELGTTNQVAPGKAGQFSFIRKVK